MTVRWTEPNAVALYDSVTGTAFGPIFESGEEAGKFLEWLEDMDPAGDARLLTNDQLHDYYSAWKVSKD